MGRITTTAQAARIRTALLLGMQGRSIEVIVNSPRGYERRAAERGDVIHSRRFWEGTNFRLESYRQEAERDREAIRYWERKRRRENLRVKRLAHQQPKLRRRRADLVTRSATR